MRRALFTALVAGVVLIAPASLAGAAGAGGVTGPSFYVDETLFECERIILGGGSRSTKVLVAPEVLKRLTGATVIPDLSASAG